MIGRGIRVLLKLVKSALRTDLAALPQRNIRVEQASTALSHVQDAPFWSRMDRDNIAFLRTTITPILQVRTGSDLKSLRFEIDVVEYSTACLGGEDNRVEAIQESIRLELDELPMSVNIVNRERDLIKAALDEEWWIDPSDVDLHHVTERLAPLMEYRTIGSKPWMELNIKDLTVIKEKIDLGGDLGRLSIAAYRERIESFIRDLVEQNPVLRKLQHGQKLDEHSRS
jgi:type I restriction enzyme R subunit